ncbi:unnamed protein product [Echinostoma caproni]|uniref:Spaetzle domain-containing protein n=1 Tax=Echinostoma caproni TaxID=27848 RepID=A0A183ASM4_9TREM|nr:unnamed protein product [Echinostoma caproni]
MLRTIVDSMLAQLHPSSPWVRLNQGHTIDSDVGEPDIADTTRLVNPRHSVGYRISSNKPPPGLGYPPFSYEPLDPDGSGGLGWKQPTFPWHPRPAGTKHTRPDDCLTRSHHPYLTGYVAAEGDSLKSDENRTIYDHLIDKNTDVTYLDLSDSSRPGPILRSKSSSPPRHRNRHLSNHRHLNEMVATPVARKLPPPPNSVFPGIRSRGPFGAIEIPSKRWIEFDGSSHNQKPNNDQPICVHFDSNVLTDFRCANRPIGMKHRAAMVPNNVCTLLDGTTHALPFSVSLCNCRSAIRLHAYKEC